MIVPRLLAAGDLVAIIAPGSPVDLDLLAGGVARLEAMGLRVRVSRGIDARLEPPYAHLAGSDAFRAASLIHAWTDPEVRAVIAARGGTGCTRLVAHLAEQDWAALHRDDPPWLVGASDVTALHLAFRERLGVATLFGPMPASRVAGGSDPDRATLESLSAAVMAPGGGRLVARPLMVGSRVVAPVIGGTITVIESLLGTREAGRASGCIALLEDTGEPPRKLDRALTHLRASGWLDGAVGIIVGSLTDCGATGPDVVAAHVRSWGLPAVHEAPVGHGRPQSAVPLGIYVSLDAVEGTVSW